MQATYSPDDNKLRLYAETRLDGETYKRVRSAGFIWAPKQGLFVAPMWTPGREDLLIELCGEVGDEDKSLTERAEERADRFEDYSESRAADADQAHKTVSAITDHIPLGQPILVGHHSEKRARRDAERIENGMRCAVKMWETAEYWKQRAAGAIHHAKHKERPDVRARRIKKIEADKRKQERYKAEAEYGLKFWTEGTTLVNRQTGVKRKLEMSEENKAEICHLIGRGIAGDSRLSVCKTSDGSRYWTAWDVLLPDGERYADCPSFTIAQCQEAARKAYPVSIARYDRWINHYENRLTYERAMLAESGGTAADKTGPEQGGACRCWASPCRFDGGWSYIQKVNQVSVTVLDNWGNGGGNFRRTIPFDKLSAIMTAAEVQAARDCGTLIETSCKTGFVLRGSGMDGKANRADPVQDNVCPDGPACPDPECQEERFKLMRETLKAGVQVVTANQLFPTPEPLAKRMVELADLEPGQRILEPSAGTGGIVGLLPFSQGVVAVEINSKLCEQRLRGMLPDDGQVICADFLLCNGDLGKFDRILMNPPFERGQDIAHIKHALTMLNPGGKLVAICANGPKQQEELQPLADLWIDLIGAFVESGTNVNAALLIIER